jgi:hypothetical protein
MPLPPTTGITPLPVLTRHRLSVAAHTAFLRCWRNRGLSHRVTQSRPRGSALTPSLLKLLFRDHAVSVTIEIAEGWRPSTPSGIGLTPHARSHRSPLLHALLHMGGLSRPEFLLAQISITVRIHALEGGRIGLIA